VRDVVEYKYGEIRPPFERMLLVFHSPEDNTDETVGLVPESLSVIIVRFNNMEAFRNIDITTFIHFKNFKGWSPPIMGFQFIEPKPKGLEIDVGVNTLNNAPEREFLAVAEGHLRIMIEACFFFNYPPEGVIEEKEPSRLKNDRRKKKGLGPLPKSYTINLNRLSGKAVHSDGTTGSHRSPRAHLRRGHWRNYEDHKIWIKPVIVNGEGKVKHSYRIK